VSLQEKYNLVYISAPQRVLLKARVVRVIKLKQDIDKPIIG